MKLPLLLLALGVFLAAHAALPARKALPSPAADRVLLEAESFQAPGGWVLDTQFIDLMGSPYLLAHGLGQPVKDATTTVTFPSTGRYRVWVRTKDWVAHWQAPGAPGKFQVLVNGQPLTETFGTRSATWFWQDGGTVDLPARGTTVALHDLTGFDGRCDALYFTKDLQEIPPNDSAPLSAWRKVALSLPPEPEEMGEFDLVVVGGGYGGLGSALSAARQGLKVALIQNRPVLGGNGSSEVRVWAQGLIRRGKYPHIGEMIEEFADHAKNSPGTYEEFGDAQKEAHVRQEKNISLFLNEHVYAAEARDGRIVSVTSLHTASSREKRFRGKFFSDGTGHGNLAHLAGAKYEIELKDVLGMSNMWIWGNAPTPQTFPETPWALDLSMDDFPYPKQGRADMADKGKGEWFWESGFNTHPLHDLEHTRDWNLRAVFGAFTAIKRNTSDPRSARARLVWVAAMGGTRESRLLQGDVVLGQDDIVQQKPFPDGTVPTTWDLDLHYPKEQYAKKFPDDPFISRAEFGKGVDKRDGYPVPYRCFYSTNIPNLFMAGRCISVTHEALGTVRVMRTCGMMGEVVGKAAYLCVKHQCSPRGVYEQYLDDLKELLRQPGAARRETLETPLVVPPNAAGLPPRDFLETSELPDLVIDDTQARLTGTWTPGDGLKPFVGRGYRYARGGSDATARFEFQVPATGRYEVRMAWVPHANRATAVSCTVESARNEPTRLTLNQREPASATGHFRSLGEFDFEAGRPGAVIVSARGAEGFVHVDAVQILPAK